MTDRSRRRTDDAGDHTVVERLDPLLGQVFDKRYRVDYRLAAGGFGAIYQATHLKSGHEVALKVLHREMATDPRVVARFRREGDALTSLRDPHTITAYELGEDASGALYIVMELLRGESLYERFRGRGPLPWTQVAAIGVAICSSLAEAHARGIVHRDLKPANIHLEPREGAPDFVKVLDFGIAKIINGGGNGGDMDLTNAGQMIGTFDYMSPEQMVGDCTTRSDIYTLGVLMYEMICGVRPFDDVVGPTSLLAALITRAPPPLASRARVPADLDAVVMRCLEKEPPARYADVLELQRALRRVLARAEDDDATRAIALPFAPAQPTPTKITPVDNDATWISSDAPLMLTPGSGHTLMPTPEGGLTPTPAAVRPAPRAKSPTATTLTPTPVFQPTTPPQVFPVSASLAPGDRASSPVLFPAGAFQAAPPPRPRPSTAQIRSYDMQAASSRDAWVGRAVWVVVVAVAILLVLAATGHL